MDEKDNLELIHPAVINHLLLSKLINDNLIGFMDNVTVLIDGEYYQCDLYQVKETDVLDKGHLVLIPRIDK